MSKKRLYLLNFSGPNFLARFAALFYELKEKAIETVDFQYQAHFGFGSGLLFLEAPAEIKDEILEYAKALDWKSSFVSSNLPEFYRVQNKEHQADVRFMLVDDEYRDVLERLRVGYGAEVQQGRDEASFILQLRTGQRWHFACAQNLAEARRRLLDLTVETCDLLLLDMKLDADETTPHEGVRFFDDLRAADRLLPTIIITQGTRFQAGGRAVAWGKEVVQEYWQAGAWSFLYKKELFPRLAQIIDLIVDRRIEPLVIVVTTDRLCEDLAYLFDFLRNEPVKVVRASCVPDFKSWMATADRRGKIRLVLECAKHESVSTTDLQDKFRAHIGALNETSIHRNLRQSADDWVRFHHGGIYEAMRLS